MNNSYKAFIFDLNGTMIDDMAFHVKAWYHLLNDELGAGLNEEEVKVQMYGKNSEVMGRIFGKGHFSVEEADRLSLEKEKRYQQAYLPHLKLIKGLDGFLEAARQKHIPMAIGSAAIPFNINFVLDNLHLRHYFSAIVSADDVSMSKPHPETYLKAAALLDVPPEQCIVFEDAPKGVEAALHAGMQSVALTTMHDKEDFSAYGNILFFVQDYTDAALKTFIR
ncbi:HAD family phosphatase [Agriterribacter sp.]|uniref:HAD family hydrolase n=1 Tax=Agriterribacter sp. TaxID=2821509 RepID=UPI002BB39870|nr:HAD family phosphatase [Agriterribacter sp.]HRO48133.1 HAD family phosphatase [Agriterribacter sp.]HRQ15975.1 HAD family phosphatase [Agriterribacter sp.]